MSPERRAKGGLGCPVSHPEHGDTLTLQKSPLPDFFLFFRVTLFGLKDTVSTTSFTIELFL
ncbi:MAG: hypothetical protein [Olavius algarvensis Gamma 1 endosymbiont]|nr:MAG: hypothetical protein [Olavius algarvensis Gamma 1 endosymbiont]